jgi:hypothetical protein
MDENQLTLYGLVAANGALYLLLALRLLRQRRRFGPPPSSLSGAFASLTRPLQEAIPELPSGYTWREAVVKMRQMHLEVDWKSVERALDGYEMARYGGHPEPSVEYSEVVRLGRILMRMQRK